MIRFQVQFLAFFQLDARFVLRLICKAPQHHRVIRIDLLYSGRIRQILQENVLCRHDRRFDIKHDCASERT